MSALSNTRRQFIKTLALGTGVAIGWPARSYARIIGSNDRIQVAVMGLNDRGLQLSRAITRLEGVEIVYLCDVDSEVLEKATATIDGLQQKPVQQAKDFRQALDHADVDALVIAAPDHWHGPATILACAAGKHVYVEKPASHNPHEGELMVQAARKYDRIVQMGNQRRSWPNIVDAVEELRNGVIGPVHYSRSWYARARNSIGRGKTVPVPARLDYDLWQGPVPRTPYRDNTIHYNWHWFWQWGTGEAGNNGVHTIDLSRWGMGVDYPSRVTATGGHYYWDDDAETPDTQVLTFEFADDKYIVWEGQSANAHGIDGSGVGVSFHGREGTMVIQGNGYKIFDREDRLLKQVNEQTGRQAIDRSGRALDLDQVHLDNFLTGIRENKAPSSEIEIGVKSTLLCQLGNVAHRTRRILHCDPQNGKVKDDPDAEKLWSRTYEPGWEPRV